MNSCSVRSVFKMTSKHLLKRLFSKWSSAQSGRCYANLFQVRRRLESSIRHRFIFRPHQVVQLPASLFSQHPPVSSVEIWTSGPRGPCGPDRLPRGPLLVQSHCTPPQFQPWYYPFWMKEVVTGQLSEWLSHCEVLSVHWTLHTAVCVITASNPLIPQGFIIPWIRVQDTVLERGGKLGNPELAKRLARNCCIILSRDLPKASPSAGYGHFCPGWHFLFLIHGKCSWTSRQHCFLPHGHTLFETPYLAVAWTNWSNTVQLLLLSEACKNTTGLLKPQIPPWITILHLQTKQKAVILC